MILLTVSKMAMVSNKFLAALSVRLGFHKHIRFNGTVIEYQNRDYVLELQDAEREAKGARDYWTNTKQPPKVGHALWSLLMTSGFAHDCSGSIRRCGVICRRALCRFGVQVRGGGEILRPTHSMVLRGHVHLRYICQQPPYGTFEVSQSSSVTDLEIFRHT